VAEATVSAGRWNLEIDHSRCVGSGMCAGVAPAYFTIETEKSRPVSTTVEADDAVMAAAECCPMEAITVTDVDSGKCLFPVD
jgi:ferredoxin